MRRFLVVAIVLCGHWCSTAYANDVDDFPHQAEDIRRYREEAARGDSSAQVILGALYAAGRGVPQDYAEALRWKKKAAAQGNPEAQYNLAVAYDNGQGVPRNYSKVYFWANLAATLWPTDPTSVWKGLEEEKEGFVKFRDKAAAKLSPAQLLATQKRCRQWLEEFEKRKAQK
jgi:hypothetical protein